MFNFRNKLSYKIGMHFKQSIFLILFFISQQILAQPCNISVTTVPASGQICAGQSITLNASGATSYTWAPGTNLNTTTGATVIANPTATITYNVSGPCASGGNGTQNVVVTVKPVAIPTFTFAPAGTICASSVRTFTANASNGGGGPYSFSWNFGDGNNGTGTPASHIYPSATGTATQNFNVVLTASGSNGCAGTVSQSVTVNQIPNTNILPAPSLVNGVPYYKVCTGTGTASFTFVNSSTTNATNTNYTIDWGDASPIFNAATWTTQNHTYNVGLYNMLYSVTGPNGCVAHDTLHIFVGSNPAVGIGNPGNTDICAPNVLTFPITGTSNNPPGTIYTVVFNDGSAPLSFTHPPPASVSHTFSITSCGTNSSNGVTSFPNSFSASITATNPCGTSAGSVVPIYVSNAPSAAISVTNGTDHCINTNVSIQDASTQGYNASNGACSQSNPVIWSITPAVGWTLNSGSFGNRNGFQTPSFWTSGSSSLGVSFNTVGTYTIKMVTGNDCGKDSSTYPICIVNPVVPSFTVDQSNGCTPLVVNTNNTSIFNGGCSSFSSFWSIISYSSFCSSSSYSFTGGSSSGTASPQITFYGTGNYTLQLSATNVCGTYTVNQGISATTAPSSISFNTINGACNSLTANPSYIINGCNVAPITNYAWTFTNGTPASSSSSSPSSTFTTVGNNNISLTVTNMCGSATGSVNAPVYGTPTANAGSYFTICDNTTGSMGASASGGSGGYSYSWSPGTGLSSSFGCCPQVSANTTTLYTVTVTDIHNCIDSDTVTVFVNPSPNINLSAAPTSICLGDTVFFTATGANSYTWSGSGLNSTTGANVYAIPSNSNTYNLTGTNLFNCVDVDNVFITVNQPPNMNVFPSASNFICIGQSVNLTASGASTYSWSPSTGLSGTSGANVTATPTVTTTYKVIGTTSFGCKDSINVVVNVNGAPNVSATVATVPICPGGSTIITANGASTYTWSPSATLSASTGSSVTASPTVTTTYVLTGINGANCQDTAHVIVVVQPGINFTITHTDSTICKGQTIDTISVSGGNGFTWSPSAGLNTTTGTTVIASPTVTTTYTVTGLNLIGCNVTNTTVVTVNPLPVPVAGTNTTICFGTSTNIGGPSSANMSYAWTPATGLNFANISNPVASPTVTTTYHLTQTNTITGCYDVDSVVITVVALPLAPALSSNSPICWSAGYTLFAVGVAGATYTWTGPNGFNSNIQNPTIPLAFYSDTGDYICTQFVSGCTSLPDTIHVIMFPRPAALSGINQTICYSQSANIGAAAVAGSTYTWTSSPVGYSNTNSSDVVTPLVTTTYTIHETDIHNCQDSNNVVLTVKPLPIVNFSGSPIACINVGTLFTNSTTGAASYLWHFGDGASSGITSPNHSYANVGTYVITLIATSFFSCIDSLHDTIQVVTTPSPNYTLSADSACGPLTVSFTNNSTGYQSTYSWYLGNGQTYNGTLPPATTYPAPWKKDSTFIIQLTGSNLCGNAIYIDSVRTYPSPHVDFATFPWSGCSPMTFPFLNVSVGLPNSFKWIWGDGTITNAVPNAANPVTNHTYTIPGPNDSIFHVKLIGYNSCGSDTVEHTVLVHPHGVHTLISASDTVGCAPLTINFTAYVAGANSIGWNFGNGNFGTTTTSTQVYNNPGAYDVYLYADDGCSFDTTHRFIFVNPNPNINFTITDDTICAGENILFSNNTNNLNNLVWHFGDGFTGSNSFQSHSYTTPGTYTATLVGTSATYGCTDSTSKTIEVIAHPTIVISASKMFGCVPLTVSFSNTTSFANFHDWTFGDGNSSSNFAPTHTYTNPGIYTVQYIAANPSGCNDTAYITLNVYATPTADFLMNTSNACTSPGTATILNTSTGANNFIWNDGNGNTSNLTNVNFVYNNPGTYTITLVASNAYGCFDTTSKVFTLYPTPSAGFYATPINGCQPLEVVFTDTSLNSVYFTWNFGDGSTYSNAQNPTHVYTAPGQYTVSLVIEGINHVCVDSTASQNYITVYPKPKADFNFNNLNTVEPDVKVVYTDASSDFCDHYKWNFGDGSSWLNTTDTVVPYSYTNYGTYQVILIAITPEGCADTVTKDNPTMFHSGLFVPNALMPTSGANDEVKVFLPKGIGMATYRVQIFTTWGEKIWESTALDEHGSPSEAWDGTYKNELMPQDAYVWKIDATFKDGKNWKGNSFDAKVYSKTGTVTLLR